MATSKPQMSTSKWPFPSRHRDTNLLRFVSTFSVRPQVVFTSIYIVCALDTLRDLHKELFHSSEELSWRLYWQYSLDK